SLESVKSLLAAVEPATTTVPSTVQLAPERGPLSHRPATQRGQTFSASVRKTWAWSAISPSMAPVARFALPVKMRDWNSFTTHAGTPATRTGSGGPKVSRLNVPGPVLTVVSQVGSRSAPLPSLQPARHIWSCVPPGIGNPSDGPVQPLSRSVPSGLTV